MIALPPPSEVRLVFTANRRDNLSPCACSANHGGGAVQEATVLRRLLVEDDAAGRRQIRVDLGPTGGPNAGAAPFAAYFSALRFDAVEPALPGAPALPLPTPVPEGLEGVITSDPEVCGGELCFEGTRVHLAIFIDYLSGGYTLDRFLKGYPGVSRKQAVAALKWQGDVCRRAAGLEAFS